MTAKSPPKQRYIILGAAGYVAPRHMEAIVNTGGEIVAVADPCKNLGILDRWAPRCEYFESIYDLDLERSQPITADYCVICMPNYLHSYCAEWSMMQGVDVIVEKPAALTAAEIIRTRQIAERLGKRVNCILQMRLHPMAQLLLSVAEKTHKPAEVNVTYYAPRGDWYYKSWKGNPKQSGGILFNIGIHILDLLMLAFGSWRKTNHMVIESRRAFGEFELERATVTLDLSTDPGIRTIRRVNVDDMHFDFTRGFEDLHTESYRRILDGRGFTLDDALPAVTLCERLIHDAG